MTPRGLRSTPARLAARWAAARDLLSHWRPSALVLGVYGVSSIVGAVIVFDRGVSGTVLAGRAALAATAAALAVVLIGTRLVTLGRRIAAPGAWFLAIALAAGAVRAVVLLGLSSSWIALSAQEVATILASSCLSAVVWLGLPGMLVAGQDRYRAHYRALVAGRRAAADVRNDDWDGHPEVSRLKSAIRLATPPADAQPSPEELARASAAIRAQIEETLRPLSHRLWFGAHGEEPHVRWSQVIRDAVSSCTVPVVPVTLLWLGAAVFGGSPLLGASRGLASAVISTLLLLACLALATRVLQRHPGLLRGLLALAMLAVVPIMGTDAILRAAGVPSMLTWSSGLGPLLVLALGSLLLLSAAVSLAWADRRTVLDVVAHQRMGGQVPAVAPAHVSEYLHNTLQSQLTGLAMQLDAAAAQQDAAQARTALERIHALINRSIAEEMATATERPAERAGRVAMAWQGICSVDVRIDPGVTPGRPLADAISAAEELIANAVRHGRATQVRILVAPDPAGIALTCWSNSQAALGSGPGLGTQLLASVAAAGVDVVASSGGTTVRLVLH